MESEMENIIKMTLCEQCQVMEPQGKLFFFGVCPTSDHLVLEEGMVEAESQIIRPFQKFRHEIMKTSIYSSEPGSQIWGLNL